MIHATGGGLQRRRTLDNAPRFDIRVWFRDHMLTPSSPFATELTFAFLARSHDGRRSATVGVVARGEMIELSYPDISQPARPVRVATVIVWTATRFGGKRPWLLCPNCDRRAAVLYFACLRFACSRCARRVLPYGSQCETPSDRWRRRAGKLRSRLGTGRDTAGNAIRRPKHMHQLVFNEIVDEIDARGHDAELRDRICAFSRFPWARAILRAN